MEVDNASEADSTAEWFDEVPVYIVGHNLGAVFFKFLHPSKPDVEDEQTAEYETGIARPVSVFKDGIRAKASQTNSVKKLEDYLKTSFPIGIGTRPSMATIVPLKSQKLDETYRTSLGKQKSSQTFQISFTWILTFLASFLKIGLHRA